MVKVQKMNQPDPFNSPKKIITEPILNDIMGNGQKNYGSVLYKRLSTTVLIESISCALFELFSSKECGITDKKFQIIFTGSELLPAMNWI